MSKKTRFAYAVVAEFDTGEIESERYILGVYSSYKRAMDIRRSFYRSFDKFAELHGDEAITEYRDGCCVSAKMPIQLTEALASSLSCGDVTMELTKKNPEYDYDDIIVRFTVQIGIFEINNFMGFEQAKAAPKKSMDDDFSVKEFLEFASKRKDSERIGKKK